MSSYKWLLGVTGVAVAYWNRARPPQWSPASAGWYSFEPGSRGYDNPLQPMAFADACLVRMAELRPDALISTLDRDFHVYRKYGRQTLSLVTPW